MQVGLCCVRRSISGISDVKLQILHKTATLVLSAWDTAVRRLQGDDEAAKQPDTLKLSEFWLLRCVLIYEFHTGLHTQAKCIHTLSLSHQRTVCILARTHTQKFLQRHTHTHTQIYTW